MKTSKMTVDELIPAPKSENPYVDWHQDDTERDPTPANKRRTEMYQSTQPKPQEHIKGFHGKQLGIKSTPDRL